MHQTLSNFFTRSSATPSSANVAADNGPPLQISPNKELQFVLNEHEAPQKKLELKHPGGGWPIAFKVRTTQPKRYLVRPNQGLIQPGETVELQISMVQKEYTLLWCAYKQLGCAAMDNVRDKLMVQSIRVGPNEGIQWSGHSYDDITKFWRKVRSSKPGVYSVSDSILLVEFIAPDKMNVSGGLASSDDPDTAKSSVNIAPTETAAVLSVAEPEVNVPFAEFSDAVTVQENYPTAAATPLYTTTVDNSPPTQTLAVSSTAAAVPTRAEVFAAASRSNKDVNTMSKEELKAELTELRAKYDQLASFSLN